MILAIDVGGTKTLLALYAKERSDWVLCKEQAYKSAAFSSINELIKDFLAGDAANIMMVCAGVAGTVIEQECKITNLSWRISAKEIQQATRAQKVYLLNDLAATAWAVALADMEYEELNTARRLGSGDIAILSAGTGLGEAILIREQAGFKVLATEGGHTSFAPQNKEQDRLLVFLRNKYNGHVSYERIVSGMGLHNIYQFLKQDGRFPERKELADKMQRANPAEIIGLEAVRGNDSLCLESVRMFCEIYAAEAGNLALKCLPQDGVVLAGGIPPKILSLIKPIFIASFIKKGRYSDYLAKLPVRICMNERAVLLGALAYAKRQVKE